MGVQKYVQPVYKSFILSNCIDGQTKKMRRRALLKKKTKQAITYLCTVMEKANIPTRAEHIQKFHKGTRPF
jgi:hypothetical protein